MPWGTVQVYTPSGSPSPGQSARRSSSSHFGSADAGRGPSIGCQLRPASVPFLSSRTVMSTLWILATSDIIWANASTGSGRAAGAEGARPESAPAVRGGGTDAFAEAVADSSGGGNCFNAVI